MKNRISASNIMRMVSVIGIICLLALQWVWWGNMFREVEMEYLKDTKECLNQATEDAIQIFIDKPNKKLKFAEWKEGKKFLKGNKRITRHSAKNPSEIPYLLEEALLLRKEPISAKILNLHFNKKLKEKFGYIPPHSLKILRKSNLIEDSVKPKFNRIALGNGQDTIYHQIGFMAYAMVVLPSPIELYLRKGAFILILSIVLMLLIGSILIFQYKNMHRDRKFAEFIIDYTRMMTHELRTPVTGIQWIFESFQNKKITDPEMKSRYIQEGAIQTKKLLLNIDNILYMAQSEQRDMPVNLTQLEIRPFIEKIVANYRDRNYFPKVVRIETHYEPANFKCRMDYELMEDVLCNLLENAIKYTHIDTLIQVSCIREGNDIKISVRDNGMGMSAVDQKRIFELFERGSFKKSQKFPGFGIGLHLVERVVKAHGGKISVVSEPGKGAEFIIKYTSVEVS
ncbi:MAG TPA: HAMP domain-containing sensor histidine kinase [Bacteroidales bacterium]|nr:HAMP domain-containing sensor histidine kinase [Bacteroidales bacterium]